jgi:hypothetical protein
MCLDECSDYLICVIGSLRIVVAIKVRHILNLASIGLEIVLSVAHWYQFVTYRVQKQTWNSSLRS